ncbi:retron Eco8 family effector endonuclease [Pseudoalteromonas sp. NZS37]|uniref:retron Eco8 family effector endonuclease n=1 Tax=Pseudoalteromonas sp. NZS37 TaxID=2792071 RepID=UPI0018CDC19F|nr:retron Eco8 family effector endonuclease [Pseudoalteromonas sp. NZS37]MBG9990823.1 AAA family ATPase [Pseudoalteromonas sp. NZS37]
MSIKSIEIKNLFSYEYMKIDDVKDINCIVGKNNVGKSNILKALRFFYGKLEGKRELGPELYSNYTSYGSITIEFDTERLHRIVRSSEVPYFKRINTILFKDFFLDRDEKKTLSNFLRTESQLVSSYPLTLHIRNDGLSEWSIKNKNAIDLLSTIYPFFEVDARHMNLHEWDKIWHIVSSLKTINFNKIPKKDVELFFNEKLGEKNKSYSQLISIVDNAISTKQFTYKERILNYIKLGLKGDQFEINGESLDLQSDGTNAYNFTNTLLTLLIALTRSEYISPFIFLDEPELGLHPKLNEGLISNIHENFIKYGFKKNGVKIKTKMPSIFISTHSPNIVKEVIIKFQGKHQVLHISKDKEQGSLLKKLHSTYKDSNFLSTFSDNEARLYFSDHILFVEGQTELEAFGNLSLRMHFKHLSRVDVYSTSSNTTSESINPGATDAAIKYLFLFDADKAYSFKDKGKNELTVQLEKNGRLFNLRKQNLVEQKIYYKKGFSAEFKRLNKNINNILDFSSESHKVERHNVRFTDQKSYLNFHSNVEQYLLSKNVKLIPNTFEGCLICLTSASLFYQWLKIEKNIDLTLFVKKARKNSNERRLIDFLRIKFKGKSETLKSEKQFRIKSKSDTISGWGIKYFEELESLLKNSEKKKKTDGWVTQFLNFSINEIERESLNTKIEFEELFSNYFPELHDIITRLQSDR